MSDTTRLLLIAIGGMAVLLLLIIRLKLHALVALVLVSAAIGLATGMTPDQLFASVRTGMGGTLGAIALLVGLGAMFGQMLEVSGGAQRIAQTLMDRFGEKRAQWSMALTGFIVGIPVFFDVGFIILVPVIYGLVQRTGRPLLYYGIPLTAGMVVTHAFVPPTPGPIAVAELLKADLGYVILFGIAAGLPSMILAGPLFGRWIARRVPVGVPEYIKADPPTDSPARPSPGFWTVAVLIALPLVLILAKTISGLVADQMSPQMLERTAPLRWLIALIGEPVAALLIVAMLCFHILGTRRGYSREQVQSIATKALEPAGIILLVTGAGGVLKQVLVDSQVGKVMADALAGADAPLPLMAFTLAAAVRVMQGSATVAMMTGGGLVASLLDGAQLSEPRLALLVVAIASGATIASHVNDSGFWLVNRFFGLSVADTLRSWTVMTAIVALTGLSVVLALWTLVP